LALPHWRQINSGQRGQIIFLVSAIIYSRSMAKQSGLSWLHCLVLGLPNLRNVITGYDRAICKAQRNRGFQNFRGICSLPIQTKLLFMPSMKVLKKYVVLRLNTLLQVVQVMQDSLPLTG